MSNQGTGTLWVPGFAGILGVREDGGTLVLGSTTLLTTSLSNVAGEVDQFVPASGKVLTVSNTLTLAGTDDTTMTFPSTSATVARTDAANTFTGTQTFSGAVPVTGVITPTGGLAAAGGFSASPRQIHTGAYPAIATTSGNDSTPSTTETYVSEIFVPCNMTITGVALFNGSNVTGNVTVGLATSAGAPIAAAKSATTAGVGVDAYQRIPFAVAYAAVGPAIYYLQVQYDAATMRYNTHTVGNHGVLVQTGQTYGTLASFTPPTTFVTNVGNMASLY